MKCADVVDVDRIDPLEASASLATALQSERSNGCWPYVSVRQQVESREAANRA
jgi:hypothetical protein